MAAIGDRSSSGQVLADEKRTHQGKSTPGEAIAKIPEELRYALVLFVASRVALTAIGILAYKIMAHKDISQPGDWFKIWDVWDSTWYLGIAEKGYSTVTNSVGMANYNFFPLYPLLMRPIGMLLGNYPAAGLVVSNACLFIACIYLYRLVRLDSDEETSRRAVKYMFLFPTAFILSAILTESLFLAMGLASIYYARTDKWPRAGLFGLLATLTRSNGMLLLIPLTVIYLRSKGPRPGRDGLCVLLVPAGMLIFLAYAYTLTGDILAPLHAAYSWGHRPSFPVVDLVLRMMSDLIEVRFEAYFTIASLTLLAIYHKKLNFEYLLYGFALIVAPLFTIGSAWSMARYILPAFPLFIILAKLAENKKFDLAATVGLAILQGILMALWTTWTYFII